MTHPPEWPIGEPCPVCGSPDILECELRIGADKIEMGWECRECGHSTTWTARPDIDEGHVIERRIVEHMPLHAITASTANADSANGSPPRPPDSATRPAAARSSKRSNSPDGCTRSTTASANRTSTTCSASLSAIIVHYDVSDADIICAALLHDSVEDHADDLSPAGRPGAFAMLTACFGPQVADLVAAVTNPIYATETRRRRPSTAPTSRPASKATRGHESSRSPTSPTTASA